MSDSEDSPPTSWFDQDPIDSASVEQVLQLGRQLASSLDEHDTLGRWLAQYIAELITTYEMAEGETREAAGRKAVKQILKLWRHRADRMGRRPLDSYEPIMAGLARVSGEATWGYGDMLRDHGVDADQLTSAPILRPALALESTVRDILLAVVGLAANEADTREGVWLDLTKTLKRDAERRAIERIRDGVRRIRVADPRLLVTEPDEDEPNEVPPVDAVEAWLRANLLAAAAIIGRLNDALDSANSAAAPADAVDQADEI
jgi:hypothetical protein